LKKILGDREGNWQNCGSRYSDGNVPNLNWNDDGVNVNWYSLDNANDNLRARREVSKKEKSPVFWVLFVKFSH
jgi:hypothetical protein